MPLFLPARSSAPLDGLALHGAEPRAGRLVSRAEDWSWTELAPELDTELFDKRWPAHSWREYLAAENDAELDALRRCTHTGRPLGAPEFVQALERATHRQLTPLKGGRPISSSDPTQQASRFAGG